MWTRGPELSNRRYTRTSPVCGRAMPHGMQSHPWLHCVWCDRGSISRKERACQSAPGATIFSLRTTNCSTSRCSGSWNSPVSAKGAASRHRPSGNAVSRGRCGAATDRRSTGGPGRPGAEASRRRGLRILRLTPPNRRIRGIDPCRRFSRGPDPSPCGADTRA